MSKDKKEDYGSRFLYAEDFLKGGKWHDATVTIEEVIPPNTLTAANGQKVNKPTLKFVGKEKMLVLCKTNQSMIAYATGSPMPDAAGKQITLQVREVEAFGAQVVALRIMPAPGVKIRKSLNTRLGTKAEWNGPKPAETKQSTDGAASKPQAVANNAAGEAESQV